MDLYLTKDGDLALSPGGDLALVENPWRNYAQQAYIRMMTTVSDFALYPTLGADLDELVGLPQSKETGELGIELIKSALTRDGGVFATTNIEVRAVPISLQSIRFDIYITAGSRTDLILSLEQDLGFNN